MFLMTLDANHLIGSIDGCGGHLDGAIYATAEILADCTVTATFLFDEHVFADGFD